MHSIRSLLLCLCTVVVLVGTARAGSVPVTLDVSYIRAIQTYAIGVNKTDDIYLLVDGVARGKTVQAQLPEGQTAKCSPKNPAATDKKPWTLWKGELADGEFVYLAVALMHQGSGKQNDAALKAYRAKQAAGMKAVAAPGKKTLDEEGFEALVTKAHAHQQELAKGIKEIFSRKRSTDHFGGLFGVTVWNQGGEIVKRVDPVGLTSGEHYGTDVKTYSKIKYTRENVLYQDTDGEWYEYQLAPVNDEEDVLRVKMLETELVEVAGEPEPLRNVTDYLLDVEVRAQGEKLMWELGGEHPGPTIVHDYWDFAE